MSDQGYPAWFCEEHDVAALAYRWAPEAEKACPLGAWRDFVDNDDYPQGKCYMVPARVTVAP